MENEKMMSELICEQDLHDDGFEICWRSLSSPMDFYKN
jgi:hypothetical protein